MGPSSVPAYLLSCFAFLVVNFLLLLFDFYGAQQEGEVLQMNMMLQV
jgi:hypothetical protein